MRTIPAILAIAVLFFQSIARGQDDDVPFDEEFLAPLIELMLEMKGELEVLRRRVEILEQMVGESAALPADPTSGSGLRNPISPSMAFDSFAETGADTEALQRIVLAPNPSEANVREYVARIRQASAGQNSFSSDDPQVGMLVQVGPKYVYVLVESLDHEHMFDLHTISAINVLANDTHKPMILSQLGYRKQLVDVVLNRHWQDDARQTLIQELQEDANLPWEWITAVARLRDPSTYESLLAYFINNFNRGMIYRELKDLPGIQLADAVPAAWLAAAESSFERQSFAPIAAEYGVLDALAVLFDNLNNPMATDFSGNSARSTILRLTDARGTNSELRAWFDANRHRLVFDSAAKKFRPR